MCHPANPAALNGRSLVNYLRCEAVDAGLPPITPVICSPNGTATIGDPITVSLGYRVNFLSSESVDGSNPDNPYVQHKAHWLGVNLRGEATMRIERTPSYPSVTTCP